jgi:hypothetical protein
MRLRLLTGGTVVGDASTVVVGEVGNSCYETIKRNCLCRSIVRVRLATSVQQLLIHQLLAYIVPVARIPVFISAETASPEFSEERSPLFCTTHLLTVELSPNVV